MSKYTSLKKLKYSPPTRGSDRPLHYHSIYGEILPHFYVKNNFLAQKLIKLELFKEILENVIEKSLKIQKFKSTNICW